MIVPPAGVGPMAIQYTTGSALALPSWTGDCDNCGLKINLDEPYLYWALIGKWLWLHVGCAVDLTSNMLSDLRAYAQSKGDK